MTDVDAILTLNATEVFRSRLKEIADGGRGFVSISHFAKEYGLNRDDLIAEAKAAGFRVARHGRYGYCTFFRTAA